MFQKYAPDESTHYTEMKKDKEKEAKEYAKMCSNPICRHTKFSHPMALKRPFNRKCNICNCEQFIE